MVKYVISKYACLYVLIMFMHVKMFSRFPTWNVVQNHF